MADTVEPQVTVNLCIIAELIAYLHSGGLGSADC